MRVLPPVHSPITGAMVGAGAATLLSSRGSLAAVNGLIEARYGPARVITTDTGTSALRLAIGAAAALSDGPVAMPAYGCYDLVSALRGVGAAAVFYDLDPRTLGPDPASLGRALEGGAAAVVVAYLFGIPVDLAPVRAACDASSALLIEDAAQGIGGTFDGRPLGAHGDLAVLSFARGKGRTGAGGGALLANTPLGRQAIEGLPDPEPEGEKLRVVGHAAAQWAFSRPSAYALPRALPFLHLGETRYRPPRPPRGMSEASAAILAAGWSVSDAEVDERRARAERYEERLTGRPGVGTVGPPGGSAAGYLRFPVLLPAGVSPEEAGRRERLGIVPSYPKVLTEVCPAPGDRASGDVSGAAELARTLWTLPAHGYVSDRDVERIVRCLDGDPA